MSDLFGLGLIAAGGVKLVLAYFIIRNERAERNTWWPWPLSRGWRLAGSFTSTAVLFFYLGRIVIGNQSTLDWWEMLIVSNVVLWPVLLWWDWALNRPPRHRQKGGPDGA